MAASVAGYYGLFTKLPSGGIAPLVVGGIVIPVIVYYLKVSAAMREYMKLTDEQNLEFADMAKPRELNEIIWFSVRGGKSPMPEINRLPAFDILTASIRENDDEEGDGEDVDE